MLIHLSNSQGPIAETHLSMMQWVIQRQSKVKEQLHITGSQFVIGGYSSVISDLAVSSQEFLHHLIFGPGRQVTKIKHVEIFLCISFSSQGPIGKKVLLMKISRSMVFLKK